MASGSFELSVSGKIQAKITWSSSSNGSSANSSTVYADIYVRRTDGYTTRGHSWRMYLNIGGSTTSKSYYDDSISVSSDWVWMGSHSATIGHNNDGTRSVYISGEIQGPSGTAAADWTSSGGQWCGLDTIPRASDIGTFSHGTYLDQGMSITYTSKARFKNKVRISVVGAQVVKWIETTEDAGTKTKSWTFSASELNTIYSIIGTNKNYATIGVVIETWNGSTKIGETTERTANIYMPESIKPSVTRCYCI